MRSALFVIVKVAFAGIVGRSLHEFGTESHELAHFIGYAEHGDQSYERVFIGDDVGEILTLALHHFDDVHQVAECDVRIACFFQRCQQQSHSVIVNAVIVQLIEQCASLVEILQPCSNQIERSELVLHRSHGFYSNRIKPGAVAKYPQPPLMFVASPEIRRRMV